jgi:hypothetical protein
MARRIRGPSDLARETLIEMRGAGEDAWPRALKALGVHTQRPRTLSFEGYFETLTAAERGLGVAFGLFPVNTPPRAARRRRA